MPCPYGVCRRGSWSYSELKDLTASLDRRNSFCYNEKSLIGSLTNQTEADKVVIKVTVTPVSQLECENEFFKH
jgi:hypothetical protein